MRYIYGHQSNQKYCVSFDFADTLTAPVWNAYEKVWMSTLVANPNTLEELFRFKSIDWKVYVVLSGKNESRAKRDFQWFMLQNGLKLHEEVDALIFTSDFEKFRILQQVPNLLVHYDDEAHELELLPPHITGIKVPHPADTITGNKK